MHFGLHSPWIMANMQPYKIINLYLRFMPAYIIVDVDVKDAAAYEDYKKLTPGSLQPFDGKFIVRGGAVSPLEGDWNPSRIVVLQFPTMEKAKAWWSSEEYAPAKALRQSASSTQMIAVEGFEG